MKHFGLQAAQSNPFIANPMQDRSTEGKGNLFPAEAALASNRIWCGYVSQAPRTLSPWGFARGWRLFVWFLKDLNLRKAWEIKSLREKLEKPVDPQ